MSERSYHQYCPIAHALDLVGDRWALLIVRDLLLGPKRYTDLRDALPGTDSNILAARLKGLEGLGVLQRRTLPPPAASTVYELTPYGRRLQGVITELGRWGVESLGPMQPDQIISPESVMLAARALFASIAAPSGVTRAELRIASPAFSGAFGVHIQGDTVRVIREPEPQPDLVLGTDPETLFGVAAGRIPLRDALAAGAVRLDGTPGAVASVRDHAEASAPAGVPGGE